MNRLTTKAIFLCWILYAGVYIHFKNNDQTGQIAGYLALIGQLGLDVVIAFYTLRLARKSIIKNNRTILLLFSLSFVAAGIADGIYNLVLNIYNFQYNKPVIASFFEAPFAMFLFLQLCAWSKILFTDRSNLSKTSIMPTLPYIIISLMLLAMFMLAINWQIDYLSVIGIFQAIDTLFEVIGFSLVTICLAREQSDCIRYLAIGYLLIVSSDIIIRYHVISGMVPYLSSLEMAWMLGLVLVCFGLLISYSSDKVDDYLILRPVNSLQSQITAWLLVLWLASIILYSGVYCLFLDVTQGGVKHLVKNSVMMIVPFSLLAILSSSYISKRISSPLSSLEMMIAVFFSFNNFSAGKVRGANRYYIHELNTFEDFVADACLVAKEKYIAEMDFGKIIVQVAHDIRSPLGVLNILAAQLSSESEESCQMMRSAISRINSIADDLLQKNKNHNMRASKGRQPVIISRLVEKIVSEKKLQFLKILIKLTIDSQGLSATANIEVTDFMRMMSNLINNAVESMDGEGVVEISVSVISGSLSIVVHDYGCGIDPSDLENIFLQGRTSKENGFGLGLSNAKAVMDSFSGEIKIESNIGKGTRILLTLPVCS